MAGAAKAVKEREAFGQMLDAEAKELRAAKQSFRRSIRICNGIKSHQCETRPYNELVSMWQCLDALEADCTECASDRQQSIHGGDVLSSRQADSDMLYAYLYADLDETYPVLADGVRVLERIRETKREIVQELTRRA